MRFRLRTLLIAVGSFLLGLAVAHWIDRSFYAMLRVRPLDIPYFVKLLRGPGELMTFWILGDSDSEIDRRPCEIFAGTVFYTCLAFGVFWMACRKIGKPPSASLRQQSNAEPNP